MTKAFISHSFSFVKSTIHHCYQLSPCCAIAQQSFLPLTVTWDPLISLPHSSSLAAPQCLVTILPSTSMRLACLTATPVRSWVFVFLNLPYFTHNDLQFHSCFKSEFPLSFEKTYCPSLNTRKSENVMFFKQRELPMPQNFGVHRWHMSLLSLLAGYLCLWTLSCYFRITSTCHSFSCGYGFTEVEGQGEKASVWVYFLGCW